MKLSELRCLLCQWLKERIQRRHPLQCPAFGRYLINANNYIIINVIIAGNKIDAKMM